MPSSRTLHTVRAATSLASARPAYAAGLRAAIVTVIPLVIDAALGTGGGTWMSLGGFNVALSDRGGPYRIRAATMGAVTIVAKRFATCACATGQHDQIVLTDFLSTSVPMD